MPITSVSRPDGSIADVSHPEGASEEDIINFAFEQYQLGLQQEEDEDEEGGFFDAIGLGVDVLQQQLGSAVEGIGEATGIDSLTEYGREVVENNEKEIAENSAGMTSFDELAEDPSFGEAWKFYKEQLGQQVPQLAGSLGVATAGGALAGPLGAVAGAAIGYLPVFYGQHRESQKEAIDRGLRTEMDEGAALLSAIPSASLDFIVDRLLLPFGGAAGAQVAGTLLTRGVKGAAKGVITEVPTEIGQEIIDRYQAGLAIDDEEAIKGYRDVAIAAGLVGGTARGGYDALTGQPKTRDIVKEEDAIDPGEFEGLGETLAEADPEEIGFAEETVAFDAITKAERTKQKVKKAKGRLEQTEAKEPSLEGRTPKKLTILVNRETDPSTGESIRTYQVVDENLFRYTKPTQDIVKATNDFDALEAQINLRGALEADREAEKTRDEEEGITPDDDEYGPTILSSEREDELKFHAKQEAVKRSQLQEAIQRGDDKEIRRLGGELSEHTRVIDEINAEIQAAKTPEQIQEEQEAKRQALAEIRGEVAPVTLESKQEDQQIQDTDTYTVVFHRRGKNRDVEDIKSNQNLKQVDKLLEDSMAPEASKQDLLDTGMARIYDYSWGGEEGGEIDIGYIVRNKGTEQIIYGAPTSERDILGKKVLSGEIPEYEYGRKLKLLESREEMRSMLEEMGYGLKTLESRQTVDDDTIKDDINARMAEINAIEDTPSVVDLEGGDKVLPSRETQKPEGVVAERIKPIRRNPAVKAAMDDLLDGKINGEQYANTIQQLKSETEAVTEGINVAKDKKADVSFANLIVNGDKKYETRDQNKTLKRFVGKRIGIIETRDGPAKLVGYATVGQPIEVNEAQFNELRDQHLVPKGSEFDIKKGKTKFLYPMLNPESLPTPVDVSKNKGNMIYKNIKGVFQELDDLKFQRNPELQEAIKQRIRNEITIEEYNQIVDTYRPVAPYTAETAPMPADPTRAKNALAYAHTKGRVRPKPNPKAEKYGLADEIIRQDGLDNEGISIDDYQFRLDIPAYTSFDQWVVSIHKPPPAHKINKGTDQAYKAGTALAYESAVAVKDPRFGMDRKVAAQIASGVTHKATIATMRGKYDSNYDAKALGQRVKNILSGKEGGNWTQVGMDPFRHSYFYDRNTMRPVVSGSEAIQVGGLVLVKDAKTADSYSSYLFSQNPNAKITKKATKGLTREITDIEKAVEGKTAFEAIEYIAKNGKNKPRRIIAKKVAEKIKELEENGFVFDFEVVHPGSSSRLVELTKTGGFYKFYPFARKLSEDVAAGQSLLDTGKVKTSEELFKYSQIHVAGADLPRTYLKDDLEDTILHEFVHAVTSRSLDLGSRGKLSEGTEFNILTKDLAQVNNHLVSEYRKRRDAGEFKDYSSSDIFKIEYALSSPHELITMAMTNPATQRFMESVQYKKGTAWSEFIESIRKLLGLPADMDTALNEVSRITEAYIDIPAYRHLEAVQARMEGRKLEQPMAIAALESDREKAENNVSLQTQAVESAIQKDETSQIETAVRQETIADPAINRTEVNTPSTPAASFESPSRNGYQQKWDRFIYQVQDKLLGLKQIEEAINRTRRSMGLEPLTALESPYKGDERIPGIVSGKIKDLEDNEKMPLIREMIEKGVSERELNEFLMLRHAMERNEQIRRVNPDTQDGGAGKIRGVAMTDNFVRGFMKKNYDMEWNRRTGEWKGGNDRAKVLLGLSSKVDAITKKTIDEGRENGLFSEIDAKIFKTFYKYYVPLKGHAIEDEFSSDLQKFGAAGSGGTRSEAGRIVERAKGRGTEALPPLGSIFHDREMMIVRGVKNKEVGINLVNLIKKHPAEDTWELIDPKNPKYQAYFDSFYTYIGDDPIDGKYGERATDISDKIDKKNWVKRISQKQVPQQSRGNLFGAKVDGEQFFIEFKDKDLERALLNLDAGSSTRIIQMLGSFNRYLSFMNTSLNPEFMLGNFPRDLQTALANLHAEKKMEGGAAPVKASITRIVKNTPGSVRKFYRGIRGSTLSKEDQSNFDEYIRSGAKTDWFHSRNPEEQIADIKNLISMNNGSFTGSVKRRFKSTINFVDDVNSAVENGVRFATFVEARDRFIQEGVNRPEAIARAASLAKNLTVNFNRKGMNGDTMNALYLFYNASVQGTANLMRGIGSKKKLMSAMIGMGYLTSMLADEMSDEDEYREGLKDFQKTRNMLIPKSLIFGDKAEGDQFIMIPLPYGYNVFHVIGMAIYDMQKGYISEPKAAALVTKTFMGSFSPIGTSESDDGITAFAKTFTPTVGTPVVDYLSNENFFGAPVKATNFPSYNAPKLPQSSLKLNSTPEALRRFTETLYEFTGGDEKGNKGFFTLDVSPDVLNHMIDFTTGAAGATAMRAVGTVERAAEGEFDINQTPFLRKYLAEGDEFNDTNTYFERRQKLINTDDYFRNETKGVERGQYFRENKEYIELNRQRKRIDKIISTLRKRLRRVRARAEEDLVYATRVAPQEEERIEDEIQKLMSDFNDLYDEKIGIDK